MAQEHGYEDLFNSYMNMLESSSFNERTSDIAETEEDQELSSFDHSILDTLQEELENKFQELQDRLSVLDYGSSPNGMLALSKSYDYGADFSSGGYSASGVVSSGQGRYNAGNIRDTKTGKFLTYNSPEEGFNALVRQLNIYQTDRSDNDVRGTSTLLHAMGIYAPKSAGNDPVGYANFIAKRLGISPNTQIKDIDTRKWAEAVSIMEGNRTYLKDKKQQGGSIGNNNVGGLRNGNKGFQKFDTPLAGSIALVQQIQKYQDGTSTTKIRPEMTLRQAMHHYAPEHENDTEKYINTISGWMGISPDTPIQKIDKYDWAKSISRYEGVGTFVDPRDYDMKALQVYPTMQMETRDNVRVVKQYGGGMMEDNASPATHGYEQLFSSYMDMLEASTPGMNGNNETTNEEDPYSDDTESVTNSNNEEQMAIFADRVSEIETMYNEKMESLNEMITNIELNNSYTGMEMLSQSYDMSGVSYNDKGTPVVNGQSSGTSSIQPFSVPTDKLNFTAKGESKTNHVGAMGAEIGNVLAEFLGGKPVFTSIHRTKEHQTRLKRQGAPAADDSYHLSGNAVDLTPQMWNKLTSEQVKYIKDNYKVLYHNNHYHIQPKSRGQKPKNSGK